MRVVFAGSHPDDVDQARRCVLAAMPETHWDSHFSVRGVLHSATTSAQAPAVIVCEMSLPDGTALELLATRVWTGTGVLGPEAFDAKPFLDLLAAPAPAGYGSPWGMEDRAV